MDLKQTLAVISWTKKKKITPINKLAPRGNSEFSAVSLNFTKKKKNTN